MRRETVSHLVVFGIAFLGISYIIEEYAKNVKRREKKQIPKEISNYTRTYYPIGKIVKEDNKFMIKKIK